MAKKEMVKEMASENVNLVNGIALAYYESSRVINRAVRRMVYILIFALVMIFLSAFGMIEFPGDALSIKIVMTILYIFAIAYSLYLLAKAGKDGRKSVILTSDRDAMMTVGNDACEHEYRETIVYTKDGMRTENMICEHCNKMKPEGGY
jgi:hypothetical protein